MFFDPVDCMVALTPDVDALTDETRGALRSLNEQVMRDPVLFRKLNGPNPRQDF